MSTSETGKQPRFSTLRGEPSKILEGEIDAAADHREVILRPINDAPAQVIGPADAAGAPKFKAESEMAERLCLAVKMMTLRIDGGKLIR